MQWQVARACYAPQRPATCGPADSDLLHWQVRFVISGWVDDGDVFGRTKSIRVVGDSQNAASIRLQFAIGGALDL
jgi:hypothetical protein